MRTDSTEEFARGKLEWNVGLLKCINRYKVIVCMGCLKKGASILYVDVQVRFVHGKILPTNIHNGWVDLDTIDRYGTIYSRKLVSDRPASQANNGNAMELLWCETGIEVWCGQKIIPVPAC